MIKLLFLHLPVLMLLCMGTGRAQEPAHERLAAAIEKPLGVLSFTFDSTMTSIPPEIEKLFELRSVRFEHTPIQTLPDEFFSLPLKSVVFVGTTNLDVREVVKKFARCPTLEILGFDSLELRTLPEEIGQLQQLKILGVWNNQLSTLPASIGNMASLEGLSLHYNTIDSLPESVQNLSKLETVLLDGNRLKHLPVNLLKIPAIKDIGLNGNPGLDMRKTLKALSVYDLREIWIDQCSLYVLPPEIGNFPNLEWLSVMGNFLEELPAEITRLTNLVHLHLAVNRLTHLPDDIGALPRLKYLQLDSNQLCELPRSLDGLSHQLVRLTLYDNSFSKAEQQRLRNVFGKAVQL